ncbi:MAG TPA: cytochrome C oxidase subunit IV family protein [Azospirillum sp.]|nr:cytochrome C oxidase subunit IV family protein [Azospirillum sp.]
MTIHRLTIAWGVLLTLSVTALVVGNAGAGQAHETLGVLGAAGVLATSVLKGREILLHYLELKHAGRGWRVILVTYLLMIAALVLLAYAAENLGWLEALQR